MINRDSRGRQYLIIKSEIFRSVKDYLLQKHSLKMFLLIKNEN